MKKMLKILLLLAYTGFVFFNTKVSDWNKVDTWDQISIGQPMEDVRRILGEIHAGAGFVDDWQVDFSVFGFVILSRGIEVSYDTCTRIEVSGRFVCEGKESDYWFATRVSRYWGILDLFWFGSRVDLDAI